MTPRRPHTLFAVVATLAVLTGLVGPAAAVAPERSEFTTEAAQRAKPQVTLKLDRDQVYGGSVLGGTIVSKPALKKAPVRIEGRLGNGKWQQLVTTTTDNRGRASLSTTAPTRPGSWQIRAVVTTKQAGRKRTYTSKPRPVRIETEKLVIAETAETIPDAVAADPQTTFDEASGDLSLPAAPALDSVVVGDTLVVPPGPGFSSGLLRRVTAIEQTGDTVTYETVQGRIVDVLLSIPADQALAEITLDEVTLGGEPCPSCTNPTADRRRAARRVGTTWNGPGFTYPVLKQTLRVGGFDILVEGQVKVDTTVKVAVDTDLRFGFGKVYSDLMSYDISAGATYESSLSATWKKGFDTTNEGQTGTFPLGKALKFKITAAIGPLKIPMDISFQPQLELSAKGEIKLSTAITHSAEALAGVRASRSSYEDPLVPEGYTATEKAVDRSITLEATGEARAALGVEGAVDFYSIGGPRVTGGWQIQATSRLGVPDEDNQEVLSCELTHGPYTNVTLGLSDKILDALTSEPPVLDVVTVDWDQNLLYRCPDGTNPPEVGTVALKPAVVGEFYLDQLDLTDEEDRDGTWSATGLPDGLVLQESGSIVGTPAAGTAGTYQVKFLFVDEKGRKGRETLELVVNASGGPKLVLTSPYDTYYPMDIRQFTATGATPSTFGSLAFDFNNARTENGVMTAFVYISPGGGRKALRIEAFIDPPTGQQGARVTQLDDESQWTEQRAASACLTSTWRTADYNRVEVSFDGECLETATNSDLSDVRGVAFAAPTFDGDYVLEKVDWVPGPNTLWSPGFALVSSTGGGTTPDPDASKSVELADPEGDQVNTDFNSDMDLTRVTAMGADASSKGRIDVDFSYIVERGGSSYINNILDVDADGSADYVVVAGRRLGTVSVSAYRRSVSNENRDSKLSECFTFSFPGDGYRASIAFDGACLKNNTGRDFSSVRLRVEVAKGDGSPNRIVMDQVPENGTWSPPFAMVG